MADGSQPPTATEPAEPAPTPQPPTPSADSAERGEPKETEAPGATDPGEGTTAHEPSDAAESSEPAGWLGPALWVFVPLAVLVVAAVVFLPRYLTRDHLQHADAGDCVRVLSDDRDNPYRVVDCDAASASLRVLARIPAAGAAGRRCQDVPGVSEEVSVDGVTACLGDKDVDPATAVNGAKEGDCLTAGTDARVVDCAAPDAVFRVVKVLADVPGTSASTACAGVAGATATYSWTIAGDEADADGPQQTFDLVLCLAPNPVASGG